MIPQIAPSYFADCQGDAKKFMKKVLDKSHGYQKEFKPVKKTEQEIQEEAKRVEEKMKLPYSERQKNFKW